jgi:hypothetical protein
MVMKEGFFRATGRGLALFGLVIGLLAVLPAAPACAEAPELPLRLSAVAANVSNVGRAGMARLDITVNRWSTDEERATLFEALKDPARRSLPNALFDREPVGRIREIQGTGEDLRYSRIIPTENGQQIILATDRPLGFMEAMRSSRTTDYNVTLVILNLNQDLEGEGQLLVGAELSWDEEKNQITIEHFASQPVRLTTVKPR